MKNLLEVESSSTAPMPRKSVKPIQWSNLLTLASKTRATDRKHYRRHSRPISIGRLWHLMLPKLDRPLFIIGAPRSGTTFLGACIGEIPEISYHFEPVATKAASHYIYHHEWSFTKASRFYQLVYGWLMHIHADGDLRFAEKTPRNCFIIDFLNQAFPNAQFIHIIRDGRDAALSYSKKPWLQATSAKSGKSEPGGYAYGPYARFWVEAERTQEFEATSDIHRCIWAWRRFTESALSSVKTIPADRYHELQYEDLVAHPHREAQAMLDFMGIDNQVSRRLFQAAVANVRPDSVGQWKKELNTEQLHQVKNEAENLLKQLGYSQ